MVFTLTVALNFIVMAFGAPPDWIVYSPLPFLFILLFTGQYMFWRPHFGSGAGRS